MNRIIKRICAFLLCISIIFCNSNAFIVHAEDNIVEKVLNSAAHIGLLLLADLGAIVDSHDFELFLNNNEVGGAFIQNIWNEKNITANYDESENVTSVTFSKDLTDALLKSFKEYADEKTSDEKGYTLHQTVPLSKISSIYFDYKADYYTLLNMVNDSNSGFVAFSPSYDCSYYYIYKLNYDTYYVLSSSGKYINQVHYPFITAYKSYSSWATFDCYRYNRTYSDDVNDSFSYGDTDRFTSTGTGYVTAGCDYDFYKAYSGSGYNPLRQNCTYLVSKTGVSIPVFDSLDALVDYSVANGLYYTSSAYTGEGKEITIDLDTLNDILDGYYDGMYDMLQQLIADSSFTLDPEQLQELVDAVQSSYGLIADSLKVQTSILSDMRDRLSSILGYLKNILSQVKQIKWLTAIDTVFDGLGLLTDLADWLSDFLSDTASGVVALSDIFDDVSDSLSRKFPFSIPWDIEFLLEYFADTPAVPHFELPFKMEKYGIDYTIEIDFSRFEILSKLSRSILTSVFIIGLMRLTERVVKIKENA